MFGKKDSFQEIEEIIEVARAEAKGGNTTLARMTLANAVRRINDLMGKM